MKQRARHPLLFFVLVFVLTLPLWTLSPFVRVAGLPDNLPVTDAAATFVPALTALMLLYRSDGWEGVGRLLMRTFDFRRIENKTWYLPIIFLMPALYCAIYWVMRVIGLSVPDNWEMPAKAPLLLTVFFFAAAGEELGYMGYAIDPMQARAGALRASLVMGALWAVWHFPSMIEVGQAPALMAWGFVATVSFRVLYVWLYNNTGGCIFGVILFHAIANTGRSIFPGGRSHFELADASVGYAIISLTGLMVAWLWDANTLTRFRWSKPRGLA